MKLADQRYPGGMTVTIHHDPRCGTSRNTLALLRDKGVELTVVRGAALYRHAETVLDLI